jgi:hypothetical protein
MFVIMGHWAPDIANKFNIPQKGDTIMQNSVITAVTIIGDVLAKTGQEIKVLTKAFRQDGTPVIDPATGEQRVDTHPVLVQDEKLLDKITEGKKIGFRGGIKRQGALTKLVLDPSQCSLVQKDLKGRYVNKAAIVGPIVFARSMDADPNKRNNLTVGIAPIGTSNEAIYTVVWRQVARVFEKAIQGFSCVAKIEGFMRSRPMLGARSGDTMYELNGMDSLSKIVSREPIKSTLDTYQAPAELLAFEFDQPEEEVPATPDEPGPIKDDIPF